MATRVVVHVTGGIAAYKACEVVRELQRAGCDVRACMTLDATRFVGPVTLEALTGHPVAVSLYDYAEGPIPHIDLSTWADAQLVAPATANVLAKMATGIADDAVTATLLAARGPVVVAPAMNVRMWGNAATQSNVATLRSRGVTVVEPATGRLACGDRGAGKLASVAAIVSTTLGAARADSSLDGLGVVVTAGPTHEAIDAVRYIANASSGKMGYAIAAEAACRGAEVTLVSGPVALAAPHGVRVVPVTSAAEMHAAATAAFARADVAVCAAAVADYTPAAPVAHKLKKATEPLSAIRLVETVDILAALASSSRASQTVVGFAAETDDLVANATAKLDAKGCDMIVANDVSRADSTFGADTDAVTFVTAAGVESLPALPKADVARELWNRVIALRGTARD